MEHFHSVEVKLGEIHFSRVYQFIAHEEQRDNESRETTRAEMPINSIIGRNRSNIVEAPTQKDQSLYDVNKRPLVPIADPRGPRCDVDTRPRKGAMSVVLHDGGRAFCNRGHEGHAESAQVYPTDQQLC